MHRTFYSLLFFTFLLLSFATPVKMYSNSLIEDKIDQSQAGGIFLIRVDAKSVVNVNGITYGTIEQNLSAKIKVDSDGDHIIICQSTELPSVSVEKIVSISGGIQKIVNFKLADKIDQEVREGAITKATRTNEVNKSLEKTLELFTGNWFRNVEDYWSGMSAYNDKINSRYKSLLLQYNTTRVRTFFIRDYGEHYTRYYSFYPSVEFPELLIGKQVSKGEAFGKIDGKRKKATIYEEFNLILGICDGEIKVTSYSDNEVKTGETIQEIFLRLEHLGAVNLNGNEFHFDDGVTYYRRN